MMWCRTTPLLLTLLLSSLLAVTTRGDDTGDNNECSCSFQVLPEDEEGCRVYGTAGTMDLIAWHRGNESCLEQFDALERELSYEEFLSICPHGQNGTDVDTGSFKALILDQDTPLSNAMKAEYPDWYHTSDNGTTYELKPFINTMNSENLTCTTTESFCYDEISNIIGTNPDEGAFICDFLFQRFLERALKEQSNIRSTLCYTGDPEDNPAICEPLLTQLKGFQTTNENIDCPAIATNANWSSWPAACASSAPAGAGGDVSATEAPIGSGDGGTSGAAAAAAAWLSGPTTRSWWLAVVSSVVLVGLTSLVPPFCVL